MSLFKNKINIETGQIFSIEDPEKEVATYKTKDGYYGTTIKDCYGNEYGHRHEVIIAEGLQLPKHLWPIDETGRRYIVDHILPVRNGGTDVFENLRLISKPDNSRNDITRENYSKWERTEELKKKISEAKKGVPNIALSKQVYQYTMDGELIGVYVSTHEAARQTGLLQSKISKCCRGERKKHGGFRWSYEPLNK